MFRISLKFIEIKFEQKLNFNRLHIKRLGLLQIATFAIEIVCLK